MASALEVNFPAYREMSQLRGLFAFGKYADACDTSDCSTLSVVSTWHAGDQLLIGKETAKQLGMGTNMYTTELLLAVSSSPVSLLFSRLVKNCSAVPER